MHLFDWKSILPSSANVAFSTFVLGESRDEFQNDVAEIRLPEGKFIDIAWDDVAKRYVLTLFQEEYEKQLQQVRVESGLEVVQEARRLASQLNCIAAQLSSSILPGQEAPR
jgi:hypothetical protein